ncbi:MAG: methyltransferase domain-containing protein [Terriglobia bacterium]
MQALKPLFRVTAIPTETKEAGARPRRCPICGASGAEDWLRSPDRFHGRSELYQLLRCPSCSQVWLDNAPVPSEMSRHYGVHYDGAIANNGADPVHWNTRRGEVLRHKSAGAILDLGCSSGGFLATLRGPSWTLFGIEISAKVAGQASANCGAQVFVGDILAAPFPAGSFDVITCFHVFEHLYQPSEVLARVAQWLKPGGIFYTMMPNIDSAGARIFRNYWYALELPRHLYHFSPATLGSLAAHAGLREVSVTTHRELFAEASFRYIVDDALAGIGISTTPMARAKPARLPWKILRKALRLTVLPVLTGLASLAGDGESIHAVFVKPVQ